MFPILTTKYHLGHCWMCFYFRFHPLCRSFCRKKMLDFTLIHIKSICHHRWKKTFPYHEKNPSPHLHQAKFQGKPGIRLSEKTSTLNRSIFLEKQAKKKTSANKRQYISCFQYKSLKGFLSTKSVWVTGFAVIIICIIVVLSYS